MFANYWENIFLGQNISNVWKSQFLVALCKLQKTTPTLSFPELGSWSILQSFMNNELNSMVGLARNQGPSLSCTSVLSFFLVNIFPFNSGVEDCISSSLPQYAFCSVRSNVILCIANLFHVFSQRALSLKDCWSMDGS